MFQSPAVLFLSLSIFISFGVALNLPALQILNTATTATTPLTPANKSLAISPVYTYSVGRGFGDKISLESCQNAADGILATLPYSHRERLSFGDRCGAGGRGTVVPLPYISISSDGECLLEIVSYDASRSDYATILQFQEWAPDLLDTCKIDDVEVTGGVAGNLGTYGTLGLLLTKFDSSNIACRKSSRPAIADCETLLNKMSVEDAWRVFGKRGASGVEVALPYTISEQLMVWGKPTAGRRCFISVSTTGPPDRENWYMVWKYAAAVAYMCVSERRASGAAYGLGVRYGKMYIEMGVRADALL